MFQLMNWICLISVSFLVLQVMVYFCKDVIGIYETVNKQNNVSVGKAKVYSNEYLYKNKVAK